MVNYYHQKNFIILKSNIMSKSNVKTLQYKQNIWKGNINTLLYRTIFKKWRRLVTMSCMKKIYIILTMTTNEITMLMKVVLTLKR